MIPLARLELEQHPTNPPRPISFHVQVFGVTIAILTIEEVRKAFHKLAESGAHDAQT